MKKIREILTVASVGFVSMLAIAHFLPMAHAWADTPPSAVCGGTVGTLSCPFSLSADPINVGTGDHTNATYFQQSVTENFQGSTLPLNNLYFASVGGANNLAACLGKGATVSYVPAQFSSFTQPTINFPSGRTENAGVLIAEYETVPAGSAAGSSFCKDITTDLTAPSNNTPSSTPSTPNQIKLQCNQVSGIDKAMLNGTQMFCSALLTAPYSGVFAPGPGSFDPTVIWTATDGTFTNVDPTVSNGKPWNDSYMNFVAPASIAGSAGSAVAQEPITITVKSAQVPSVTATESFTLYQEPALPAATLPAPVNNTASCTGGAALTSLGAVPANYQSMRYINIAVTNIQSFVGFNEIQVYDANGNLIPVPASNVWASSAWVGNQAFYSLTPAVGNLDAGFNSTAQVGVSGLIDGNLNTQWNNYGAYSVPGPLSLPRDFYLMTGFANMAGGAASSPPFTTVNNGVTSFCPGNLSQLPGCPYGGMFTIDLGSVQKVSRISLLAESTNYFVFSGDSNVTPDPTYGIYTLSGGTDGSNFTALGVLGGPQGEAMPTNNQWIDFSPASGLFDIRPATNSYASSLQSCFVGNNPAFTANTFTLPSFSSLVGGTNVTIPPPSGGTTGGGSTGGGTPPPTGSGGGITTGGGISSNTSILNTSLSAAFQEFSSALSNAGLGGTQPTTGFGSAAGSSSSNGSCSVSVTATLASSVQTLQGLATVLSAGNASPALIASAQAVISGIAQVLSSLASCAIMH